mgnify:CR=1 FL=1
MAEGERQADLTGDWRLRLDMIEELAAGDAVGVFDASHLGARAVVDSGEAGGVDGDSGRLADQYTAERVVGGGGGVAGPVETFCFEMHVALIG